MYLESSRQMFAAGRGGVEAGGFRGGPVSQEVGERSTFLQARVGRMKKAVLFAPKMPLI